MKKLVKVEEIEGEGLTALLGENVTLFCLNYIYAGKLIGVNQSCVLLEEAYIVYETGSFDSKKYHNAQRLSKLFYVQLGAIESFGVLNKEV